MPTAMRLARSWASIFSLHAIGAGREPQLLIDQPGQAVLEFPMSRHGRLPSVARIDVDVVFAAMALQTASLVDKVSDELPPFQGSSTRSSVDPYFSTGSGGVSSIIRR